MRFYVLGAAIGLIVAIALLGFVFSKDSKSAAVSKPIVARYWTTAKLEAQLAPKAHTYLAGTSLVIPPGWTCRQYESQRLERVVLVCSQ